MSDWMAFLLIFFMVMLFGSIDDEAKEREKKLKDRIDKLERKAKD